MGVFTYSYEEDTPSAKLPNHVADDVMNARREQLMAVQQEIMFDYNDSLVGKKMDVIIDGAVANQPGAWVGRTQVDAPDVDGCVIVTQTDQALRVGCIVECEIVQSTGYDLVAAAIGEPR